MLAIAVALLLSQTYPPFSGGTVMNGVDQAGNAHPPLILPPGALGVGNAAPPNFSSRTPYFNGQLSYQVTAGPLVGDGGLGILATNYTASTVSCYQVQPTGALATPVNTTVTGNPRMTAMADFNEDGFADFAVTNRTANVQVFFGSGGCKFAAGPVLSVDGGAAGQGIITAKLGSQAHESIVVADRTVSLVSVFFGGGDGGFLTPVGGSSEAVSACPTATGAYQMAVTDFNVDGYADVILACNGVNYASLLFGLSDGGFDQVSSPLNQPTQISPTGVAVGDLNGDGIPDAVLTGEQSTTLSGRVEVLLGNATKAGISQRGFVFQTPSLLFPIGAYGSTPGHVNLQGLAIADFNGDNRSDVVASVASGNSASASSRSFVSGLQFLAGYGNGLLDYTLGVSSLNPSLVGPGVSQADNVVPLYMTTADLNGDGIADVIVPNFGIGTAAAGLPNLWTILSSAPPIPVTFPQGVPLSVQGAPGGNMGVSAGPASYSTVNCVSGYATYLGTLGRRRSIAVQAQYDSSPIWVGPSTVVTCPGCPYSLSDAGFSDAGPGTVGEMVQSGGYLSKDLGLNSDLPGIGITSPGLGVPNTGLFCIKASGAQDGTYDGGWTTITELP